MTNNLSSNTTEKLMDIFLDEAESTRVVTKTVDRQILSGEIDDTTGGTVSVKRPHKYNVVETVGGDIGTSNDAPIISGKATAVVQPYYTVPIAWTNKEEALDLNGLEKIIRPAARECITRLETNLSLYMMKNAGLSFGTVGTAIGSWGDVASFNSLMMETGVPQSAPWYTAISPFVVQTLADAQGGLASGDNSLVNTAWRKAQISRDFGGLQAITSNSLGSYTTGAGADRVGALNADPIVTYVAHKDTMIQTLVVKLVDTVLPVKAGDVVQIAGRNRLNLDNHTVAQDAAGAAIPWRATVTADATASGGVVTLLVAGPAIFEAAGAYNTVDSAPLEDDVVTILGAASTVYKPALFYHEQAFGLATVELDKLFSTDTVATTEDGFSIRVSKFSDGRANEQTVRFDILPAFATFNPLYAGTGWG